MEPEKRIELPPVRQLGIVVEDLDKTRSNIERCFEVGSFNIFELDHEGIIADGSEPRASQRRLDPSCAFTRLDSWGGE